MRYLILSLLLLLTIVTLAADPPLAPSKDVVVVPAFETASLIDLLAAQGQRAWAEGLREQFLKYPPNEQIIYWYRPAYIAVHRELKLPVVR